MSFAGYIRKEHLKDEKERNWGESIIYCSYVNNVESRNQ